MRRLALSIGLLALGPVLAWAAATQGGPVAVPLPLFPSDNWWNQDVSHAPVDPRSSTFISFIGATRKLHPDFGGCAEDPCDVGIYGLPYVVVNGVQPGDLRAVEFQYSDESDGVDHTTDTSFAFYPIPDAAITGLHWIEGGEPGEDDPGGDRHMLIVDKDNNRLYELYGLHWDGSQWTGGSGAYFDMTTNDRRPEGWTSADAAGLAILPGLVRYDEVHGPDPIRHALRVTVRDTSSSHVFPASHTACNACPSNAPPMGARLRLKASKDISGFPVEMQKIFQAMKTYGLIVADNGSDMYVSGTFDTNWNNDILNPAFASLSAGDFEVVKLGWQPPTSVLAAYDAVPVVEGDSGTIAAEFTVTLTPAFTDKVTVRYATVAGTAAAGADYIAKSGTLTFPPGATTQAVNVPVRGDRLHEDDESFTLFLSSPVNASVAASTATATILDDDAPPALSIADAAGVEGDAGATNRLFAVTLSGRSGAPVTVDYAASDGSATAGTDYAATAGTLTFAAGVVKQTIAVPILGDLADEPDESFLVTLTSAAGASLARDVATGTITNDDSLPALSMGDATVTEGTGGTTTATVAVTLSAASSSPVTVRYVAAAGTASPRSDYQPRSGVLTFAPGVTAQTVEVSVVTDDRLEKNEAFLLKLSAPRGARIARGAGQVAILDDDGGADPCAPILAIPFSIQAPGIYCLARNATTRMRSGTAVLVAADGVTVDLGGFKLAGTAGLKAQAVGIASEGRKNVTVRNGTVRGFLAGVVLRQAPPFLVSQGLLVQNVKALSNTYSGIWVEGADSEVAQCTVSSTGRGTSFGPDHDAMGIAAVGPGVQIVANAVTATYGSGRGNGYGIGVTSGDAAEVASNAVSGARSRATTGILIDASSSVAVNDNALSNLLFGIVLTNGSTGTTSNNTMTRVTTPYVGP
jgi:Calx-beta domain/Right handed beta helix region